MLVTVDCLTKIDSGAILNHELYNKNMSIIYFSECTFDDSSTHIILSVTNQNVLSHIVAKVSL